MPEGQGNLQQRIQEQTVRSARDFCGDSLGWLESILRGDRAQLEDLVEQLPEGDEEARIRDMVGSYSKIEESLHRAARDIGVEDAKGEAARQAQEKEEETAGEPKRATRGAGDAAGAAAAQLTGAVEQAADQVGQIAEGAQDAVGQVLDRVGQVTENLPGGRLLSRTTNEAGQTVQRAVDKSSVVEITLDEAGNIVDQRPVGSLAELPTEEEYQNEEGQWIRIVKEESGTLIGLRLGEDGSILDLQVPPPSKI